MQISTIWTKEGPTVKVVSRRGTVSADFSDGGRLKRITAQPHNYSGKMSVNVQVETTEEECPRCGTMGTLVEIAGMFTKLCSQCKEEMK